MNTLMQESDKIGLILPTFTFDIITFGIQNFKDLLQHKMKEYKTKITRRGERK